MFDFPGRYPFNRRTWPYLVGGLLALLLLALLIDAVASRSAIGWPEPWRGFFAAITDVGEAYWILSTSLRLTLLAAGLAVIFRDPLVHDALIEQVQLWGFVFVGVGFPGLISNLIKRSVGRSRPELIETVGTLDFRSFANDWMHESFPSGHATTIFAFAMVVSFLSPVWFVPAVILGLLVAVSRIAVGAHYLSDTIGGAVCGILLAYLVRYIFATRRWVFALRPDGTVARRHFPATRQLLQQFFGQRAAR